VKHVLKIWPQYFCRAEDGSKTFEVRKNDRGFQPGDEVMLREYDPNKEIDLDERDGVPGMTSYGNSYGDYTGKSLEFKIGYVFPIDAERVVFSLLPTPNKNEAR
jgi:hypothetical protein